MWLANELNCVAQNTLTCGIILFSKWQQPLYYFYFLCRVIEIILSHSDHFRIVYKDIILCLWLYKLPSLCNGQPFQGWGHKAIQNCKWNYPYFTSAECLVSPWFNTWFVSPKLLYLGREYPQGAAYFRERLKSAFMKNKDETDPEKIKKLVARGDFVIKELEALYFLRKYRAMKKRYYDPEK